MRSVRASLSVALWLAASPLQAGPAQSLESIRDAAQSAAETALTTLGGDIRIDAIRVDSRLRLAACEQPLQAIVDSHSSARLIALVSCAGPTRWNVRVPVEAQAMREVAVAARPIARNEIIATADLRSERRNVLQLPRGYFTEPESAIGQQANRAIRAGTVLTPGAIAPARLVRRGDLVAVTAELGTIRVRSEGVALADGALGQRVQVRNTRSGRIIEAEVVANNTVAALP